MIHVPMNLAAAYLAASAPNCREASHRIMSSTQREFFDPTAMLLACNVQRSGMIPSIGDGLSVSHVHC